MGINKKKPIDILQGKFHYFRGDVELDDENEDKNNTNPFRIKKVGDKYEYDFVSYSDWEKIMEKYDYEGDLDGLEKWGEMERKREWEKTSKELRDLIRKRQQRIEKEKREKLGEDMDTDKNKKHSLMKIIKDLVDSLRFHKKNMKQVKNYYYLYDRQKFVSRYYDRDRDIDTNYSTDIESLSSFIVQIHKYGIIIMTDDEDRDIRTNQVIEEKKLTNKHIKELKNGFNKVS